MKKTYTLDDGREMPHGAAVKLIGEGETAMTGRLLSIRNGRATVMTRLGIVVGDAALLALVEPWLLPTCK